MLDIFKNMDRRLLVLIVILLAFIASLFFQNSSTVSQTMISGNYWTSVVPSTDSGAVDVMQQIAPGQSLPAGSVAVLELGADLMGRDVTGCTAALVISHPASWHVVAQSTSEFATGDSAVVTNALKTAAPDLLDTDPADGRALTGTLLSAPMPQGREYRHMRLLFSVPEAATREQLRVDQAIVCDGVTNLVTGLTDSGEAVTT